VGIAESRLRDRLVVVPSDRLSAYAQAGYDNWLEAYYNPNGFFKEVFALSPLESGVRQAYGMTVVGVERHRFGEELRRIGPSVVRAYGGYRASDVASAHRIPGVPLIVSLHDTTPSLLHRSVRYADLVVCMSRAVARLAGSAGIGEERIRILPNRIDSAVFRPVRNAVALRAVGDRFPPGRGILHVGRKSHQKNLDTLIRALKLLPDDYFCVFLGRGDETPYRRLADGEGVAERCFWVDSVPSSELPLWYSWCTCMCTPSRWEGFGIVFIEAAACGAAIVTADLAPMNEYLTTDRSACLVGAYERPEAIAAAIRRVSEDESYRQIIREGALRAAEPFDRQRVDDLEVEIYREAAALPPHPLSRRVEGALWRSQERLRYGLAGLLRR
jgi:glycosyltransferase involved in cell wall biosynthesis